jgi:tetrapyrrole methylase family protein/MazG family protein
MRPRIVVVGLGPAGTDLTNDLTRAAIASHEHRYLRTVQHPSAGLVEGAVAFDDVYDSRDTFDDVYAEIAERLVVAATAAGAILYAVPGSPLVLERTVRLLLDNGRVDVEVLPSMSFLDLVYARIAIDPVEAGVRLVDGHQFATAAAGDHGPLLVAHTHANWVLSDIKLAIDENPPARAVLLHHLGLPDERVLEVAWSDIDRTLDADHLTSLYIPELAAPVGAALVRFHELARTLREQCPWDREQTHRSLVKYLIEETYETVDAIEALDEDNPLTDEDLIEELGDLLYQIEFHATIAEQQGRFTMADVAQGIHDKLVRRHPHVFGDVQADDTETVLSNWDAIKRAEKGRTSVFDGVPGSLPALSYAAKVQSKAAGVGFDWPNVEGAIPKIHEELNEVNEARRRGDHDDVREEIGDLLFAVVNVARHLKVDPESALRAATQKFRTRFATVERLAGERNIDLHGGSADPAVHLAALDALWDEAKHTPPSPT